MTESKEKMLAKAMALASHHHHKQKRREGGPYIYHPLNVAKMLNDNGYEIKYQIVGVLHDVLEDTDVEESEIKQFGDEIFEAVKAITKIKGESKKDYVNRVKNNSIAKIVKSYDIVDNMSDMKIIDNLEWASRYIKQVRKYYKGNFLECADTAIDEAEIVINNRKQL